MEIRIRKSLGKHAAPTNIHWLFFPLNHTKLFITYLYLQIILDAARPLTKWPQASYDHLVRPPLYLGLTPTHHDWNHDTQNADMTLSFYI